MNKTIRIIMIVSVLLPAPAISCWAGDSWQTNIKVQSGNAASRLTLGQNKGATDFTDGFFDVPALLAGTLRAGFTDSGEVLWRDIRSSDGDKEWLLSLNTTGDEGLRVSWDCAALPDNVSLLLTDIATGVTMDMKVVSYYLLDNNRSAELKINSSDR